MCAVVTLAGSEFLFGEAIPAHGSQPSAAVVSEQKVADGSARLDEALDGVAPGIAKWATVCVASRGADGKHTFLWHDYRDTGFRTDFWPASTVKLYTAIAALELLHEKGFPLDTTVQFEHREAGGAWTLDCARSVREMLGEVFRRSSNEDYTLLLRMVGVDRINAEFLTSERGFPHSALMRGYVLGRPYVYRRDEPQRITLRSADGARSLALEHAWSGRSYSAERGCTVIDPATGNMTSPRELAECLRRVLFHEEIPEAERYRLSPEQLKFLRHGGGGLAGLETREPASGPSAWSGGMAALFPQARFFHKSGVISNYALEVAAIDDSAHSGRQFILVPVIQAGEASRPEKGEKLVSAMADAVGEWVKSLDGK